jgi:hypothetical protein
LCSAIGKSGYKLFNAKIPLAAKNIETKRAKAFPRRCRSHVAVSKQSKLNPEENKKQNISIIAIPAPPPTLPSLPVEGGNMMGKTIYAMLTPTQEDGEIIGIKQTTASAL